MNYRERFNPELEAAFEGWVKAKGIEVALFDLDDTLIDTNSLFGNQIALFLELCQQCAPHVDYEAIVTEFQRIDKQSYQVYGVSLKKWDYIVEQMCSLYGIEDLSRGLKFLYEIYETSPNLYDGARETLELCQKIGLRLGLVTHASQP